MVSGFDSCYQSSAIFCVERDQSLHQVAFFAMSLERLQFHRSDSVTVWSLSFPACSGASPVLRCDYLSYTGAIDRHSCMPTVRSFTRYMANTILNCLLIRMER
jgi:hypothetical protein